MKRRYLLFLLLTVFIITGCVSTDEHNACLLNAENLGQDILDLEEEISGLEEEKASLTSSIADLKAALKEESEEKAIAIEEKEKAIAGLKSTYQNLVNELNQEIQEGQIKVTQLKDKLSLTMVDKILFDSGSAEIKSKGKEVLDRVGEILKKVEDKQINIVGHTDNVPISSRLTDRFPTNWELSTARATTVVRYLQESSDISPELLLASGVAEYRPVDSNDTPEGRASNRRIEVLLVPIELKQAGEAPAE
ncbi:MAG: OmpA family protein [Nitrospirota bacterium]|nr:MAG: OmpA family protein [Nitrospirota bacterium]